MSGHRWRRQLYDGDCELRDNQSVESSNASRGCEFCAEPGNLYFGHVTQLASNASRRSVLLQCPRCSAYYEESRLEPGWVRLLLPQEVADLFPELPDARHDLLLLLRFMAEEEIEVAAAAN